MVSGGSSGGGGSGGQSAWACWRMHGGRWAQCTTGRGGSGSGGPARPCQAACLGAGCSAARDVVRHGMPPRCAAHIGQRAARGSQWRRAQRCSRSDQAVAQALHQCSHRPGDGPDWSFMCAARDCIPCGGCCFLAHLGRPSGRHTAIARRLGWFGDTREPQFPSCVRPPPLCASHRPLVGCGRQLKREKILAVALEAREPPPPHPYPPPPPPPASRRCHDAAVPHRAARPAAPPPSIWHAPRGPGARGPDGLLCPDAAGQRHERLWQAVQRSR